MKLNTVREEVIYILNKWNNAKVLLDGCRKECGR
jgi:hypothetical protein